MSARQEDAIRYFCQQKGITEEELGRKISEGIQKYMPPFPIDTYKKGYQDAIDKACEFLAEEMCEIPMFNSYDEQYDTHVASESCDTKDEFIEKIKKYME